MNKEISSAAAAPRTVLHLRQKPKSIAFYTPKIDVMYVQIMEVVGFLVASSPDPIPSFSLLPSYVYFLLCKLAEMRLIFNQLK